MPVLALVIIAFNIIKKNKYLGDVSSVLPNLM